ncbi:MAG: hypothetical protein NT062_07685 [Proteobacteria bacterium]|nr:hypothetical protein [Pseudomonadota bacterium]
MGPATRALVAALGCGIFLAPIVARADSCTKLDGSGQRYPICFDPGNEVSLTASSDGFGGSIAVRHIVRFEDDPDLAWKLEHVALDVRGGKLDGIEGTLYRGRYLRHTRDGHIVLPTNPPKKVFLPFDIGAYVEAGSVRVEGDVGMGIPVRIGMVKTAALIDLWRSRDFRRRLAIGPMARWDVGVTHTDAFAIARHVVAPFSTGIVNLHAESANGLMLADVTIEAGSAWSSDAGWTPEIHAEGMLQRTLLAINDRPIALFVGARYWSETQEATVRVGARIALFR